MSAVQEQATELFGERAIDLAWLAKCETREAFVAKVPKDTAIAPDADV